MRHTLRSSLLLHGRNVVGSIRYRLFRPGRMATVMAGLLISLFLCSCSPSSPSATGVPRSAPGGCGLEVPNSIPPPGVFIGVLGIPRHGVSPQAILATIPKYTVALWCARVVMVLPSHGSKAHPLPGVPGQTEVQFLAKASLIDQERAAAFLRHTGLFAKVTVFTVRHYY